MFTNQLCAMNNTPSGKPPALTMYFISYIKGKMVSGFRQYQYLNIYIWTIILLCFWAWQVTYTAPLCFHTGLEYCFTRFRSGLLLDLPHTWHHTGLMAVLVADLSRSKDRLHAMHSLRMLLHHTTLFLEHQLFSGPSRWGLAIRFQAVPILEHLYMDNHPPLFLSLTSHMYSTSLLPHWLRILFHTLQVWPPIGSPTHLAPHRSYGSACCWSKLF